MSSSEVKEEPTGGLQNRLPQGLGLPGAGNRLWQWDSFLPPPYPIQRHHGTLSAGLHRTSEWFLQLQHAEEKPGTPPSIMRGSPPGGQGTPLPMSVSGLALVFNLLGVEYMLALPALAPLEWQPLEARKSLRPHSIYTHPFASLLSAGPSAPLLSSSLLTQGAHDLGLPPFLCSLPWLCSMPRLLTELLIEKIIKKPMKQKPHIYSKYSC